MMQYLCPTQKKCGHPLISVFQKCLSVCPYTVPVEFNILITHKYEYRKLLDYNRSTVAAVNTRHVNSKVVGLNPAVSSSYEPFLCGPL